MKNLLYILILAFTLWSCEKDSQLKVYPELIVKIEKYGLVNITNEDVNAVRFSLDYGNGTIVNDNIANFPIYNNYKYGENKEYTIVLTTWDSKNSVKQLLKIIKITDAQPKAIADFSYEILDNGKVKFTNKSANYDSYSWRTSTYTELNIREENPTFVFEENGQYDVSITVSSLNSSSQDVKKVTFVITNAKGVSPSPFRGLFISRNVDIKGSNTNTFNFSWGTVALSNVFSTNSVNLPGAGNIFIIYGFVRDLSVQEKYERLKAQFKVGKVSTDIWDIRFSKNLSVWNKTDETYLLVNDPNAQLEIIDVQEIDQPKLIPEMYDKAFWVTFKIKADFRNGNNIDGTLKVRYLIY